LEEVVKGFDLGFEILDKVPTKKYGKPGVYAW
jgi:hypothetical protein